MCGVLLGLCRCLLWLNEAELGLQELAEGSGIELVIVRPPLI
jgi:hypothetical protein